MTVYKLRMRVAALLVVLGLGCWVASFAGEPAFTVLAVIYLLGAYMVLRSRMHDLPQG